MLNEFIVKYEVELESILERKGSCITVATFNSLEKAKNFIKKYYEKNKRFIREMGIKEIRYASKRNMRKRIIYDSCYKWGSYFCGFESLEE